MSVLQHVSLSEHALSLWPINNESVTHGKALYNAICTRWALANDAVICSKQDCVTLQTFVVDQSGEVIWHLV